MQIEVKNMEILLPYRGDVSLAHQAELHINGTHAGWCLQWDNGLRTTYYPKGKKGEKLIEQAKAFCETLPDAYEIDQNGKGSYLKQSFDNIISKGVTDLIEEYISSPKVTEKYNKAISDLQNNYILYGFPGKFNFKMEVVSPPLDIIAFHPHLFDSLSAQIQQNIAPKLQQGERILNTNIQVSVLKNAGLKESQYSVQKEEGVEVVEKKNRSQGHHK